MLRRRIVNTASWIVVGLVFLVVSLCVPVKQNMTWIDPVTGSWKHQSGLTLSSDMKPLLTTTAAIEPSPLAMWLVRREGRVQYNWHSLNTTWKTLWGTVTGLGCSRAPPIYSLRGDLLEYFVKSSSDDDLRCFVDVMRHGTEAEQRAAIESAGRKAIDAKYQGG